MAVYKCKSCSANLNIEVGDTLVTCEFCGATQLIENTYPGENYVKRGYMFLEEGEFEQAKEYFDKALDDNSEAYDAYLGKSLIENRVKNKEDFFDVNKIKDLDSFIGNLKYSLEYKNAIRFADSENEKKLIDFRNSAYKYAYDIALSHKSKGEYEEAIAILKRVYEYEDSAKIIEECQGLFNSSEILAKYNKAVEYMEKSAFKNAVNIFDELKGYRDSDELRKECDYRCGKLSMKAEDYMDAIEYFKNVADYKDSSRFIRRCQEVLNERRYLYAKDILTNSGNERLVEEAKDIFLELGNYRDSVDKALECDSEIVYIEAFKLMKSFWNFKNLGIAELKFSKIKKYKDALKLTKRCRLYKIIYILTVLLGSVGLGIVIMLCLFR